MTSEGDGLDGPADFVEQMYLAVIEESWLFEVPLGIGDGHDGYTHGPWLATDCSRQLLPWFDQGLIELYADPPEGTPRPRNRAEWQMWNNGYFLRVLEPSEARDLLAHPERWTQESDDGFIHLCPTDTGMARMLPGANQRPGPESRTDPPVIQRTQRR